MFWTMIQGYIRPAAIGGAFFAAGSLTQSALDKSPQLPGLEHKAAVLEKVQKVDLPKAKALASCEHKRAETAEVLAVQAVVATQAPSVPVPDLNDIPECPRAAK